MCSARTTKADKEFSKRLYFKDVKLPEKTRNIQKIKNKISIRISVFGCENKKNIQFMYQKNVMRKSIMIYH